ncbi:receptor-transporting protein 4-like [Lepisosteus oculatus]|uniref:receptor-transporting protein 4-like n=1 Tax=Lepisosteus oculatus TaxID=7918 RepID=UPI003723B6FA
MSSDWSPSLWMETFQDLVDQELDYNDSWSFQFNYGLQQQLSKEERRRGWKVYCPCAHGQFECSECSRTWPSARVVLLFHYRLRGGGDHRGTVVMRPFGQACNRCHGNYTLPGFSAGEVEETLLRLLGKIKKNCYGDDSGDEDEDGGSAGSDAVRTRPHQKSLCEACSQGICCLDDD